MSVSRPPQPTRSLRSREPTDGGAVHIKTGSEAAREPTCSADGGPRRALIILKECFEIAFSAESFPILIRQPLLQFD